MDWLGCGSVSQWGWIVIILFLIFFFFNDTATTEIYTLSLHDALPIWVVARALLSMGGAGRLRTVVVIPLARSVVRLFMRQNLPMARSEEHTSELQSLTNLVCRLLLEKKN